MSTGHDHPSVPALAMAIAISALALLLSWVFT